MPILPRLVNLYETRGIHIVTGLNSDELDFPLAPFTWFVRNGESMTNGLGIALQEVYFLECLFAHFQPRRIFVIGNSFGWSTFALALLNPAAKVVAIDAGYDRNSLEGIAFTNRVSDEEGLAVKVVRAVSPGDVPATLEQNELVPVDFAFIDGFHSVEQVELDFAAIAPSADAACLYLFHDVTGHRLEPGMARIAARSGLSWEVLPGTTSGMAIVYDRSREAPWRPDIAPFALDAEMGDFVRAAAWEHRHRHLARWRRSLRKRLRKFQPTA